MEMSKRGDLKILEILTTSFITGLSVLIYFLFFWKYKFSKNLTREGTKSSKEIFTKFLNNGKMPPIYPNGWFSLLESWKLKKGEVKHIAVLGQNFAVFRTQEGEARILNAYCPHLGANLAEGGVIKGDELECPFHAWRFCGKTGKCTQIPYAEKVPPTFKTKVWDCVEVNGLIFVWYHAESVPPYWWPKQIKQISDGTWKFQGESEYYLEGHIQDFMENAADTTHFSVVHDLNVSAKSYYLDKIFSHTWACLKWTSYSENNPEASERMKQYDEIADYLEYDRGEKHKSFTLIDHRVRLLNVPVLGGQAPMLINMVGPGCIETIVKTCLGYVYMMHSVTPVKPRINRVSHLVYSPTILSPLAKFFTFIHCHVIKADAIIWRTKKYADSPLLPKEDRYIKPFRRWYSQYYSENSPTLESCKNSSIEW